MKPPGQCSSFRLQSLLKYLFCRFIGMSHTCGSTALECSRHSAQATCHGQKTHQIELDETPKTWHHCSRFSEHLLCPERITRRVSLAQQTIPRSHPKHKTGIIKHNTCNSQRWPRRSRQRGIDAGRQQHTPRPPSARSASPATPPCLPPARAPQAAIFKAVSGWRS